MSVLVLGSSGQVASHLRALLPEATFWGRATVDITDTPALESSILRAAPTVIVNAAAYTAVDRAESEAARAWQVNAEAPTAAARAAEALGIPFIHLSTDYVFDGEAASPYAPDSAVRPLNAYGRTKLGGELGVAAVCSRYHILRTSWVFSEHGTNFVHSMLRLAHTRPSLSIVNDQYGRPTYAGDLARLIVGIVAASQRGAAPESGVYHAVGGTVVTWYAFAQAIFARACEIGLLPKAPAVLAIDTADYPTPARRPLRAVLAPSLELDSLLDRPLDWEAGLREALDVVGSKRAEHGYGTLRWPSGHQRAEAGAD